MLGDMMGNMQAKQEEMKKQLASIELKVETEGLVVVATADRTIRNIHIPEAMMEDKEQVEDLVITTVNKAIARASEIEAEESQKLIKEMLPPGMEGLLGGLDV